MSDQSWARLEEMFGTVDRISPADIYTPPEEPMDSEAMNILSRMNKGEQLTREEVVQLPQRYQDFYYVMRDAKLEAPRMRRRARRLAREALRKKKYEQEKLIYERAMRKMQGNLTLTPQEIAICQKFSSKVYHINAPEVHVNPIDILDDVVKGNYTLQDVSLAQNGTEVVPVESSPMQLLENIVEDTKKQTQGILHANDSAQFFQNIESDVFSRITPLQLDNIISSCTTGIDMMQGSFNFDENEAKSACESLLKALVMQEGEAKIKGAIDEAKKRQNKEVEKLAEAGAVAAATGADMDEINAQSMTSKKNLGFNITNTSFDVSFVPSDDTDVYKPMEIISYIGMTK